MKSYIFLYDKLNFFNLFGTASLGAVRGENTGEWQIIYKHIVLFFVVLYDCMRGLLEGGRSSTQNQQLRSFSTGLSVSLAELLKGTAILCNCQQWKQIILITGFGIGRVCCTHTMEYYSGPCRQLKMWHACMCYAQNTQNNHSKSKGLVRERARRRNALN